MANLPQDKLPDSFETVVYGTGLTESIIAGAIARVGKKVLHIDSNSFYGELWGTLLHRDVEELLGNGPSDNTAEYTSDLGLSTTSTPLPVEDLLEGSDCAIRNRLFNIEDNVICSTESTVPVDSSTVPVDSSTVPANTSTVPVDSSTAPVDSSTVPVDSSTVPADSSTAPVDSSTVPANTSTAPVDSSTVPADSSTAPVDSSTVPANTSVDSSTVPADSSTAPVDSSTVPANTSTAPVDSSTVPADSSTAPVDSSTVPANTSVDSSTVPADSSTAPVDSSTVPANTSTAPVDSSTVPANTSTVPVTWNSLGKNIRRFNYDVLPKLLHCRGKLVNLITSSGVSRYMEFKPVEKLFLYKDSEFLNVPSSRSDVFSNKSVSMLDKRRLMKFLSSCAEDTVDYDAFRDKPYREFLMSNHSMSDTLADFIVYSIAFADNTISTANGIQETKLFLNSLGRFGNAPFLYPIFGCGEIPQAFCRLCAVFGGVYCLKRSLKSIIIENKSVKGIVCSSNQRIECSNVVCGVGLLRDCLPREYVNEVILSRAMFISDRPLIPDSEIAVATVLPFAMGKEQVKKIQLIQLDSSSLNTAQGTYMVHATYDDKDYAVLKLIADQLYSQDKEADDDKPRLLRSIYYNIKTYHVINEGGVNSVLPNSVMLTSDPDVTVSYESCIDQAKHIFSTLYPKEEFLPRIPEPDEIIYEEYQPDEVEETPATMDNEESPETNKEGPETNEEGPETNEEGPETNEEGPITNNKDPVISNEETPVVNNEEGPVINEETPVINEEGPVASDEGPVMSNEQTPAIDDSKQ